MTTICEVHIENPITQEGIDEAMSAIERDASDFLVLDIGEHEFQSLAALKYLRECLESRAGLLERYMKIAMLQPKEHSSKTDRPDFYQKFSDRKKAIAWLDE